MGINALAVLLFEFKGIGQPCSSLSLGISRSAFRTEDFGHAAPAGG